MQRLALLQAWLMAEHSLKVSIGGLWKRLRHLGLTLKKSLRAAEQDRADIARAREEWHASQPDLNPERLVFIDETWVPCQPIHICWIRKETKSP